MLSFWGRSWGVMVRGLFCCVRFPPRQPWSTEDRCEHRLVQPSSERAAGVGRGQHGKALHMQSSAQTTDPTTAGPGSHQVIFQVCLTRSASWHCCGPEHSPHGRPVGCLTCRRMRRVVTTAGDFSAAMIFSSWSEEPSTCRKRSRLMVKMVSADSACTLAPLQGRHLCVSIVIFQSS